jgi:hypothetical protein
MLREPVVGVVTNTNAASWFGDPGKRYYATIMNSAVSDDTITGNC